ncbi:hypothetical protein WA026_009939 [Henosepilachna vigintioctopunctata]|uniref:SCP domain-containing protein n=1 Tax=Henosepilachna vigintioctopunctata TaxID=420089 RepID=A0AAW1TKI3_9CUCU
MVHRFRFTIYAAFIFTASLTWFFTENNAANPTYNQGTYTPNFLNYCYQEREECRYTCDCMLDRRCVVKPIPSDLVEFILQKHNSARRGRLSGDPKPSGMPSLVYDVQLEAIARCWAAKCTDTTTDCLLTESFSEIGMNMDVVRTGEMRISPFLESPYSGIMPLQQLWTDVLDGWIKEIDSLQFRRGFDPDDEITRRGAQMIHDQTLAIGCSWSSSQDHTLFYCVYGPGAKNFSEVYKSGPPCTTCPPGYACTDDSGGLCEKFILYSALGIMEQPTSRTKRTNS